MADTSILICPTPNIGGTSRAALAEQYSSAIEALQAAHDKLRAMAPHGRDYPESGRLRLAMDQSKSMLASIECLIRRVASLAEHLDQTAGGR